MIEYLHYLWDKLFNKPNLNDGFIETSLKEIENNGDFTHEPDRLGFVEKDVLKEDCQWDKFRPIGEKQKFNRETMACVSFSAMNVIEATINYFLYLKDKGNATETQTRILEIFERFKLIKDGQCNCSDRYIAKLSGTTMRGNTQKNVANAIRHYGLVPEDAWAYTDDDYYASVPEDVIAQGKELVKYIDFSYEWVTPSNFNDAKKYGPIQTSVYAWGYKKNGIYQPTTNRKNHATVNDGFEFEKYDKIFDSYEPFDKKASWYFNFGYGMIYTIKLKDLKYNNAEIEKLKKNGFQYIMRAEGLGEIYELTSKNTLLYITKHQWGNLNVKRTSKEKKLLGIHEDYFNKLII